MMIFKWIDNLLSGYEVEDIGDGLLDRITDLEARVLKLEMDNVEITNCLYEVENRLNAKIDNIHPVVYNLKNNNWDQ
jgi:hypothetical protein